MARLDSTIRWRDTSAGIVTSVSSDIAVKNSVPWALNVMFDKDLGLAVTRLGTSIVGSQLSSGNTCRGVYQHIDTTLASSILFAVFNGEIYNTVASSSMISGLTVANKARFVTFQNATLMLNGAEKRSYDTSGGWISTGGAFDLTNLPSGAKYPLEWHDRVYCAVNDRLYYTAAPSGGVVSWSASGSGSLYVEREDGGGTITGTAKVPGYILIFKERSLKRWNFDSTFPDDLVNVGTQSQDSVVYGRGMAFFFYGPKGFYATNGGYPKRISAPIQMVVDAISASFYQNVNGWYDDEHVYWSVGDLTIDFGYGYTETHNNVVVRYSIDTQEWTVYKYAHEFRAMGQYLVSSKLEIVGGDTDGHVLQLNSGTSDYGSIPVTYVLQSPEFDFGRREFVKTISDRIIVHAYPANGALLQARSNYGQWEQVGSVKGLVTEVPLKKPIRGNVIEFRLTDSITGEQVKLRGLDFPSVDVTSAYVDIK